VQDEVRKRSKALTDPHIRHIVHEMPSLKVADVQIKVAELSAANEWPSD